MAPDRSEPSIKSHTPRAWSIADLDNNGRLRAMNAVRNPRTNLCRIPLFLLLLLLRRRSRSTLFISFSVSFSIKHAILESKRSSLVLLSLTFVVIFLINATTRIYIYIYDYADTMVERQMKASWAECTELSIAGRPK